MFAYLNRKLRKLAVLLGIKLKEIVSFDLPAGWTCPAALECLSRADRKTGKITDGPHSIIRCYAATNEAWAVSSRNMRWRNFDALVACGSRNVKGMADLLTKHLPKAVRYVRVHSSGDFFSKTYFKAWVLVAERHPDVIFYAYTKRADILPLKSTLPANLRITVSHGGRYDDMALDYPRAYVCWSHDAVLPERVPIIDDETSELFAIANTQSFGLMLHGTQPKGSLASQALKAIKAGA